MRFSVSSGSWKHKTRSGTAPEKICEGGNVRKQPGINPPQKKNMLRWIVGGYVNGNYISIYTFEEKYHHQTGRVSPHLSHEDSFCIIAQICFYFREGSSGLFSRARNFSFKVNLWFTHLWWSMAFLEGFVSKKQVFSLIVFLKDRTLLHRICGNRILLGAALCSKLAWWIWFGLSPAQDAFHRQDDHIFSKGSLRTFICHRYWSGDHPKYASPIFTHVTAGKQTSKSHMTQPWLWVSSQFPQHFSTLPASTTVCANSLVCLHARKAHDLL